MSNNMWGNKETKFFYQLSPDNVLSALENLGLKTTGRCLALNSMENRVYEIELDTPYPYLDHKIDHIVAKFYRPGRWNKEQILDEHKFILELFEQEIPVIAPIEIDGTSLFYDEETNLYFCFYPRKRGRTLGELTDDQYAQIGRLLGRIHNIGQRDSADHRLHLDIETYGRSNLSHLLSNNLTPDEFKPHLEVIANQIFDLSQKHFNNIKTIRLHGDCHMGNLIWREEEGMSIVDFDDMVMGAAVQDFWLLLPAEGEEAIEKREQLLRGYEMFREFDRRELNLIEIYRALRYIHYTTWVVRRFEDPSFQNAFAHFKTPHYWQTLIQDLRVQQQKIQSIVTYDYWM